MGKLTVFLDKITNLADGDTIGKGDPYVRFHCEMERWGPDKNYGKQNSSKKRGERNPVYLETFEFDDIDSLKKAVLHCKVMDDDPFFDDKLGYCKVDLEALNLTSTPIEVERVVDANLICKDAKIYLKISFTE